MSNLSQEKRRARRSASYFSRASRNPTWPAGGRLPNSQRVLCFARDGKQGRIIDFRTEHDPCAATTEPLPERLYDLGALKRLRPIVSAVIHAFTWSLDDSLGLERFRTKLHRLSRVSGNPGRAMKGVPGLDPPADFFGRAIEAARRRHSEGFQPGYPRLLGIASINILSAPVRKSENAIMRLRGVHELRRGLTRILHASPPNLPPSSTPLLFTGRQRA
jgi:hypothetical protein